MTPWLLLSFSAWLQLTLGQDIPGADPSLFIPDCEGDVLFLTDSSGSVSYYEFSKVKAFVGDLLHPFTFGPRDVQTSIIHISTVPALEFPFNEYTSSDTVQSAIRDMKQRMGDTNTGQALSLAKEMVFTDQAGARPSVPKVLVWVTDGISSDDVSQPMELLKELGVTVFIVSTGRGNYLELSQAASKPTDKHLLFVDVDDLPIITKELRDNIIEVIRARRLRALDITPSSIQLMWPRLLSRETGYYVVEYSPVTEPGRKQRINLAGDQTGVLVSNLVPGTTYNITLIPESNEQFIHTQNIQVTTLEDEISPAQILISESGSHSFKVSWSPTPNSVVGYQILYGPLPGNSVELLEVDSSRNSTIVDNLLPNTTYLVTVAALYKSGQEKALSAKACTEEENSKVRYLHLEDIGDNKLKASWDSADGDVTGYRVQCRQQSGTSSTVNVDPQTHSVELKGMPTDTICIKPLYRNRAGKRICKMARLQKANSAPRHPAEGPS